MSELTQQFKEFAAAHGAALVGIAPPERFEDWPAETSPMSIAPEARAVVAIGLRITRGTLRGNEEGTNFNTYGQFGYNWLDTEFVALTTFECAEFLEDNGWEAAPLFPFPPEAYPQGIPVREGAPAPNVYPNFAHVAVACGLGEIGINGELLTPQFGPRQRIQLVLTDAPLQPDPVCNEAICKRCGACERACPLGAVDVDNPTQLALAGKTMEIATIDYEKCRVCKNGACANRYHAAGHPDRLGAICNRTCVDALEARGGVENTFENPFRVRDPWGMDETGKLVDVPVKPMAGRFDEGRE
jgi:epoxyqueuosine reductase QueG